MKLTQEKQYIYINTFKQKKKGGGEHNFTARYGLPWAIVMLIPGKEVNST